MQKKKRTSFNSNFQTLISGAGDNAEKRQKLANAINQKNELHGPTQVSGKNNEKMCCMDLFQYVKLRMRTSHVSTRVAIPETAREMAGWMRVRININSAGIFFRVLENFALF